MLLLVTCVNANDGNSLNKHGNTNALANGVMVGMAGIYSYTTDGGITWSSPQYMDGWKVSSDKSVSVAFASATNGVVVGANGLYSYTTDGGKTWSAAQNISENEDTNAIPYKRAIAFSSPTNGIILWAAWDLEPDTIVARYVNTTDGGKTWSYPRVMPKWDSRSIDAVAFSSPTNGIAVGGWFVTSQTTDGGQTWSDAIDEGSRGSCFLSDVAFSSADYGEAVGKLDGGVGEFGRNSYLYDIGIKNNTVVDGSININNPVDTLLDNDTNVQDVTSHSGFIKLAFSSSTNGIVVGWHLNGGIYFIDSINDSGHYFYVRTADGGHTWSNPVNVLAWDSIQYISRIAFSSATYGIIAGDSNYYYTADGGQTWSALQSIPGWQGDIYDVAFTTSYKPF